MFLTLLLGLSVAVTPWKDDEHRFLAENALEAVLRDFDGTLLIDDGAPLSTQSKIWRGTSFGDLVVGFAHDDYSPSRYQEAGKTIYRQLEEVSTERIEEYWDYARELELVEGRLPRTPEARTAVANFLVAHVVALRFADSARDQGPPALMRALLYEAIAQGYLTDAYSAGHIRVPRHDFLQAIHPVNNRKGHDLDNINGVFVINGRNQVWQAFGDGAMGWYGESYRQVLNASVGALREVLLVYAVAIGDVPPALVDWVASLGGDTPEALAADWLAPKSGQEFYRTILGMPSLSHIPMPISATWSIRTRQLDSHGIRRRIHFPQLQEPGLHRENIPDFVRRQLYSRSDFPERFLAPGLIDTSSVRKLVDNPDAASVEFVQLDKIPADYAGVLGSFDVGILAGGGHSAGAVSVRIGNGLFESAVLLGHLSVHAGITVPFDNRLPTPIRAAAAFNLSSLPLRVEYGVVTTTEHFLSQLGTTLAAELDLMSTTLKATYLGFNVRLRYSVFWLDDVFVSPSIQIEFQ